MPRRIITEADTRVFTPHGGFRETAPAAPIQIDSYTDKLAKLIPAEIVAAYIAINGILISQSTPSNFVQWVVFIVLWLFTPLYLYRVVDKPENRPTNLHILISTISFAIWIFAMGGPFKEYSWYQPYYGAIILILYTILVPIVYGTK